MQNEEPRLPDENILITGGAGFIGRALVKRCLKSGHRVTVIDNLCAGKMDNLEPFLDQIDFHHMDILDGADVEKVMEQSQPTLVFHLGRASFHSLLRRAPPRDNPGQCRRNIRSFRGSGPQGVRKAVIASTGALYRSTVAQLEESEEVAPGDVYALSKYMAEETARFIGKTTETACVAARLFNTYGPYETNPHLIPDIMSALRQGPVLRLGNVKTKRDYIMSMTSLAFFICVRAQRISNMMS